MQNINDVEPIQLEQDEQDEQPVRSGVPVYHPSPEVAANAAQAAKSRSPQYQPNSQQTCADCTTATLLLPKAQKGQRKAYISVVSYDDASGSVKAFELPDLGLAHWILFGGLVILILRGASSSSSSGNAVSDDGGGASVYRIGGERNFWEKEPEKPRCSPCTGAKVKKVS